MFNVKNLTMELYQGPRVLERHTASARSGFSIVELIVVLAVLGILLGTAFVWMRPPTARVAADAFRATIQEARTEAIKRNRPVAVVWRNDLNAVTLLASTTSTSVACSGAVVEIGRLDLREFPRLLFSTTMVGDGLIWLPNGRHVACAPGDRESVSTLEADGRSVQVAVSSGGRVTIE